jgi:hypothetical protein
MWSVRWCVSSRADEIRRPSTPISFAIAPVQPEPVKTTTESSPPPTAVRMISLASSRSRVVCRPVPLDSVWVFAYPGSTRSRMKSSTNVSARPLAV